MNDEGAADPVRSFTSEIESKAADLGLAHEQEGTLAAEDAKLAAEIEALVARRADLARQRDEIRAREVNDERAMAEDVRGLKHYLGDEPRGGDSKDSGPDRGGPPSRSAEFEFFVDDQRYETDLPRLTGLQVKAKVANWNPTHDLVLEGRGADPDKIIADDASVDLAASHEPLHFSSVPKANFG